MANTKLIINTNNLKNNINNIKSYVGAKTMMPIIKANGYGTYINKRIDIINEFEIVGVAEVQEGIKIRKLGYKKEIFILNQPSISELNDIYENQLTIGLSSLPFLEKIDKEIKVHLEIETGMNRTGIKLEELDNFIKKCKEKPYIKVVGIYTHFSSADNDLEYTNKQFEIFEKAVEIVKKHYNLEYIHCSASNGLLNFKETISNTIRPGIILYGYESFEGSNKLCPVKPIATLKTEITFIKKVKKGEAISYNQTFKAPYDMKVGTIPIGYADGLKRSLSNQGEVVINKKKHKIIGNICMDSCMIDLTDTNYDIGDSVYIWDNDTITIDEIAKKCNTINYEILSTIGERVERIFE